MKTKITMTVAAMLGLASTSLLAQQTTRSVWDGVYTADQANRGKAQYNDHCASCHDATLTGNEMAPALVGSQFLGDWTGLSVGDLTERTRTTMPADDPGSLGRKTLADIVAFLLMSNQFPAGTAELPDDAQLLQNIRIDATNPGAK